MESYVLTKDLYDLSHTKAAAFLEKTTYPWEALADIKDIIMEIGASLPEDGYYHPVDDEGNEQSDVWIAKDAVIFKTAFIKGPCIIGHNTEVRHCAFIRGSALVGDNCVVGNSTELKNVILFDNVQVPHYNYVGDSVLGYRAHMGAGSITSNVKSDKQLVDIKADPEIIHTERKKVGAMIGDNVEVGCGSVLNPGTVICRNANIYPLSCVRGVVPAGSIYKKAGEVVAKW